MNIDNILNLWVHACDTCCIIKHISCLLLPLDDEWFSPANVVDVLSLFSVMIIIS